MLCGWPWPLTFHRAGELKESFSYLGWKLHVNSPNGRGLHPPHTSVRPALQSTGLFPAAGLPSRLELWWKDSSKRCTNTFLITFAVHPISSFLIEMSCLGHCYPTRLKEGPFLQPCTKVALRVNQSTHNCLPHLLDIITWQLIKTEAKMSEAVRIIRACISESVPAALCPCSQTSTHSSSQQALGDRLCKNTTWI